MKVVTVIRRSGREAEVSTISAAVRGTRGGVAYPVREWSELAGDMPAEGEAVVDLGSDNGFDYGRAVVAFPVTAEAVDRACARAYRSALACP